MSEGRKYTACCGLFCKDCIPSREGFFATAKALADELDALDFGRYAALKAEGDESFSDYGRFRSYLSRVISLVCPGPCAEGGGKPDCAIRSCAGTKGYAGCWECADVMTCPLLAPFEAFHGDTPRKNLLLIKTHGIDNWADKRGAHYIWNR